MRLDAEQIARLKANALRLSREHKDFFLLDSCGLNAPLDSNKYECLIGIGSHRRLKLTDSKNALSALRDFLEQPNWYFGVLAYDLKNDIEVLDSFNDSGIDMPTVYFVEPEVVISLDRKGDLRVIGAEFKEYCALWEDEAEMEQAGVKWSGEVSSRMSENAYLRNVEAVKELIRNGDVYELNLCYAKELRDMSVEYPDRLFQTLIKCSPVPFGSFVRCDDLYLLSASPERFMRHYNGKMLSQPIKGTSARFPDTRQDRMAAIQLEESIKERAENVMIVDLVRNDLSRFSIPGTVSVEELFGIHSFAQVHQMISSISSEVKDVVFTDVLRAAFPMGSMTGTPKIAAMKHIEMLESDMRGWYSGSVGYIDPEGNFDLNVIIRSMIYDRITQRLSFSVGGAITIDSDPQQELSETRLKAKAITEILGLTD